MIESPQDSISFEPLATEDPDSAINKDPEQTAKPQPITASFRKTIRHLHSIGGFRARFRGVAIFFVKAILISWIAGIVSFLPIIRLIPRGGYIVGAVACAQLSVAWTHIVISEPSPKTWFRRLPSKASWKKVAGPTAVLAVAEQLSVSVPLLLLVASGVADKTPDDLAKMTPHQHTIMSLKAFGIAALGLVMSLVLVVPANVVLTRVQASILPDTEETIVPFDRSFGGKVIPEIVGGSGVIGMLDAWKTFDWAARIRVIKAYVKVALMQLAVTCLFTFVFVAELFMIVGKDWSKLVPEDGKDGKS